jgi:hypothetical protein
VLIIHSVQKLLNTSRLVASLYVTQPSQGQHFHSWYARLVSSSFRGKMLVMYVHEPSLVVILCKGKTIQGTWKLFLSRFERLLTRFQFSDTFIKSELSQTEGYIVSKTNSKSLLAVMNQMVFELEYDCSRFHVFEDIPLDWLEDRMMERPHQTGKTLRDYITPKGHWQNELGLAR